METSGLFVDPKSSHPRSTGARVLCETKPVRLLAAIWNLYLGLFSLLGHGLLVLIGIALCGYATMQQLNDLHDTTLDCLLFAIGIILVGFSSVRRWLWTFTGLAAGWTVVVAAGAFFLRQHEHEAIEITPALVALAAIPPLLLTLYLEATRPAAPGLAELEISLSQRKDLEH